MFWGRFPVLISLFLAILFRFTHPISLSSPVPMLLLSHAHYFPWPILIARMLFLQPLVVCHFILIWRCHLYLWFQGLVGYFISCIYIFFIARFQYIIVRIEGIAIIILKKVILLDFIAKMGHGNSVSCFLCRILCVVLVSSTDGQCFLVGQGT